MSLEENLEKYYLIDLNPNCNYGLNHQLWCIADALIIAHYVNRKVMVRGFYPDYNNRYQIDLSNIINIEETNNNLLKKGFRTSILPFNKNIEWNLSRYPNPVYNDNFTNIYTDNKFDIMIEKLKEEKEGYIDLYTCFVWPLMLPYNYRQDYVKEVISIFLCLEPSALIKCCVQKRLQEVGIQNSEKYNAIHLRMEDDWVTHLTSNYKHNFHYGKTFELYTQEMIHQVCEKIQWLNGNKLFTATGLKKSENQNNYILDDLNEKFPSLVYAKNKMCSWKEVFSGVNEAREIEGYIDFLICLNAEQVIASYYSSFSVSLKYCREYLNRYTIGYDG
jgi:hypothetical protein